MNVPDLAARIELLLRPRNIGDRECPDMPPDLAAIRAAMLAEYGRVATESRGSSCDPVEVLAKCRRVAIEQVLAESITDRA